ncbi:MAG TPA: hypothetical protein VIV57_21885 [Anaeromyxobacter sp.]
MSLSGGAVSRHPPELALVVREPRAQGQRIVHQVTAEKGGSAFFLTVMAWPK